MYDFPSADSIRKLTEFEVFLYRLKNDLILTATQPYIRYNIEKVDPNDLQNIKDSLTKGGYAVKVCIDSWINTNTCDKAGCLVYHIPVYEPQKFLYISLREDKLPVIDEHKPSLY
jgi:hypothetical protein